MHFQASNGKGNNFMDLLDDDLNIIKPSYIKGRLWLQAFGHSNSLCTRATQCYNLKLKGLSNRTTLVLSNTRELDRVPNTK